MSPEQRELNRNIKLLIEKLDKAEEPITEAEAGMFLGLKPQTMRDYVCSGRLSGTYIINSIGKRMYYKSKLIAR